MSPHPHFQTVGPSLRPVSHFTQYTASGAAAGALFTGVGAVILHVASPDTFHRPLAVAAGGLGGAATHAVLGVLSAFDGVPGMSPRLVDLGKSLPIAAVTSGVLGGGLLSLCGVSTGLPSSEALVLSGALGGALVGLGCLAGTVSAKLMCVQRPGWTRLATGDLEVGERLMAHHPATKRHWWQRRSAVPAHAHQEAVAPAQD